MTNSESVFACLASICVAVVSRLPARVEHITELTEGAKADADRALRSVVSRSLVVPSEGLRTFALVPLVADFLRKQKPDIVAKMGDRLENCAYALAVENGYQKHNCKTTRQQPCRTLNARWRYSPGSIHQTW